jgi:hypothetical protein
VMAGNMAACRCLKRAALDATSLDVPRDWWWWWVQNPAESDLSNGRMLLTCCCLKCSCMSNYKFSLKKKITGAPSMPASRVGPPVLVVVGLTPTAGNWPRVWWCGWWVRGKLQAEVLNFNFEDVWLIT